MITLTDKQEVCGAMVAAFDEGKWPPRASKFVLTPKGLPENLELVPMDLQDTFHFSFSGLTIAEAKEQLYNKCFEWQRRIEKVMLESQIERLRVQCSEDSFVNTVAAHGQRKVNALEALNSKLKLSANSSFNAEVTSLSKAKALSIYQGVATAVGEKLLKADEN